MAEEESKTSGVVEKKPAMTDEERLELAKKLDRELDDFINNLPRRKYEDGWPEDRWEEEMEKHPFFMKKPPQPGDDLHPLYEGLQQLKYDPNENSPEELATSYKEDGNFNFKHKNYRLAILSYTEGIKLKCGNPEIESSLLNNRSAANYFLQNYRSSLEDSKLALKINPNYTKVLIRTANCCFHLNRYDTCVEYCDVILAKDECNEEIIKLRKNSVNAKKGTERDARKKQVEIRKKTKTEEDLLKEILSRGVNVDTGGEMLSLNHFEVHVPVLIHNQVHLDETNNLVWPVVFLYPEHQTMDFVVKFSENDVFNDHLVTMFEMTPDWDHEKKYTINNLNVYYENPRKQTIHVVNRYLTLKEILQEKTFLIRGGTPSFLILCKNSPAEKNFLEKY